ncbi:Reverse transcriptase zinc-binding domain, partial [Thalictrum thalictroides]
GGIIPTDCEQFTLHYAALHEFSLPIIPEDQQARLRDSYNFSQQDMDEDKRVWPHDNSGDFTIKSFVRLCQGDHPKYPLLKRIWSAYIPTKVSFFIWKLLHGAIATDTAIKSCNVSLASRCHCCSLPSIETNHHLFLYSDLAKELWRHFNTVFDIKWPRFYNLSTIIGLWFRHGIKGSLEQLCFSITPLLILWEVWKERSARRYEENHTPLSGLSLIFKIREGNHPADYLSKKGMTFKANGAVHKEHDKAFKQLLHADRENIPYVRHAKQ